MLTLLSLGISRRSGGSSGTKRKPKGTSVTGPVIDPHELSPRKEPRESAPVTPGKPKIHPSGSGPRGFHQCPLCGTILRKNERVKSILYPGKPDGIMEIQGCPYCFGAKAVHTRICPVCSRPVPDGEVIYARFFESPQRRHVHVLGCRACYTRHGSA